MATKRTNVEHAIDLLTKKGYRVTIFSDELLIQEHDKEQCLGRLYIEKNGVPSNELAGFLSKKVINR